MSVPTPSNLLVEGFTLFSFGFRIDEEFTERILPLEEHPDYTHVRTRVHIHTHTHKPFHHRIRQNLESKGKKPENDD